VIRSKARIITGKKS